MLLRLKKPLKKTDVHLAQLTLGFYGFVYFLNKYLRIYFNLKRKNLVGNKSVHNTDVTNASRTMLMNLKTLEWDDYLCDFFSIPKSILPEIKSSAEDYGAINSGCLKGVHITAVIFENFIFLDHVYDHFL